MASPRRDDLLYPELSYAIVGILFDAHQQLGNRLQEKYYQRAIAAGLGLAKIPFREQVSTPLRFHGVSIGSYVIDFIIDDKIALEIKAVDRIGLPEYRQARAYLAAFNLQLAILANFRPTSLEFRRILNTDVPTNT
jgi:GxxExxY protein